MMSSVFRYAIVTLRFETDPTEPLKGALQPPKITNRPAITDEKDFRSFLRSLVDFNGSHSTKQALLFQILTMTRPGEVRGASIDEFDLAKGTWTVPSERMKLLREHTIPLSRQAMEIVEGAWPMIDGVTLLFPLVLSNRRKLSEYTFNTAPRRMGYDKDKVTAHGFRSTASTILNCRNFDGEVIEAALAHQHKNEIRRTYNRSTY